MVEAAYIIDVVLDVSGICRGPPWVGRRGQVMRGILPEGLLASRNTRSRVVGPRGRRCIVWIPQQVDVKGVLQGEKKRLQIDSACTSGINTLKLINWKKNKTTITKVNINCN